MINTIIRIKCISYLGVLLSAFNIPLGHNFFIFCFTDFFLNKLVSEDEIKIKIKFIRTIFQLNLNRRTQH